nr:MAG TPA: hypothetical protein [Caudoviricetes sp.]
MYQRQTLTISFLIKAIWKSFGTGITFRRYATSATAERLLVKTAALVTLQESDVETFCLERIKEHFITSGCKPSFNQI